MMLERLEKMNFELKRCIFAMFEALSSVSSLVYLVFI